MASLATAANVYNTCLIIMRKRGYRLWIEGFCDRHGNVESTLWMAEKNGYDFAAENPIELLGLVSIYEWKSPQQPPHPYWWPIKGDDIYDELLENMVLIKSADES